MTASHLQDIAWKAAFYSAANVVSHIDPTASSLDWITLGTPSVPDDRMEWAEWMADFVEAHPTAPAEALWRYVCGWCDGDSNGFFDQPDEYVLAYCVFRGSVLAAIAAVAELKEHRRKAEQLRLLRETPPMQGPVDVRGTLLERGGSLLDPIEGLPPPTIAAKPKRSSR